MPGIYGLVSKKETKSNLQRMLKSMYLYDHFIQDELFYDGSIAASRTHIGKVGINYSPVELNGLYVWVEGEAYNVSEVAKQLNLKADSLAELLLNSEYKNQLNDCLNKLDGFFCAALYNKKSQKLKIFSDRYGMQLLYWYHKDGVFIWGSEVKAILAVQEIDKELSSTSFDCFMDLGYLLGDNTWFKNIHLIKPATVLEYNLSTHSLCEYFYWKWSEIKPSKISFDDAVEQLGDLFIDAVSRHFDSNEKIGIALSGGLDSRAIFAAVNHLYPDYEGYAYTFGIPDCDDIEIANQVISRSANWHHEKFIFSATNWYKPRIKKVWDTDGMQDMMHMHGSEFLPVISSHIDINLNGYIGGEAFGDSYQEKHHYKYLNNRITPYIAKDIYGQHVNLTNPKNELYDINHIEPFDFMNRSRRFINMGTKNSLTHVVQRKPQMDNKVLEFIFSIPDEYRVNNKLYAAMLKNRFPKYFLDIPWEKTGEVVGITKPNKTNLANRIINRGKRELKILLGIPPKTSYTNYPQWIRDGNIANQLINLLDPESAEYTRFTGQDLRNKWLFPHLESEKTDNSVMILRLATIEIYLRKVFTGELP